MERIYPDRDHRTARFLDNLGMRYGYAAINTALAAVKIQVNRSLIRKTLLEKGISYVSTLALANIKDLEKIVDWNIKNKLLIYRMSSDMIPWMSEFELADLPAYEEIATVFNRISDKVAASGLRLTYHPGPFNVLATNTSLVLTNTIKELRQHAEIMDMLRLPRTPFAKINIHVGGAFGDKISALARFADNFTRLPDNVRLRLTVENDDKINMFSISDLMWLHEQVKIPITFDYFHHEFCSGNLTEEEAALLAVSTWPAGIPPVFHFSSSRRKYEDPSAAPTAHADYIYSKVNTYNADVDIMFEAKAKEAAVIKYLQDYRIKLS